MRYLIIILAALSSCVSSTTKEHQEANCKQSESKDKIVRELIDVDYGCMDRAWYESGSFEEFPGENSFGAELTILVDSTYVTHNFISHYEEYCRDLYHKIDTSWAWNSFTSEEWEKFTDKEKEQKMEEVRQGFLESADREHEKYNQGQLQVWIINNTSDTITFQMQDGSHVGVLQAKSKKGNWHAVEYWVFSGCGNSYYNYEFPPGSSNSFVGWLPKDGDFETVFRYKILGKDQFYYSNEFEGRVDYCRFAQFGLKEFERKYNQNPRCQLRRFRNLVWNGVY